MIKSVSSLYFTLLPSTLMSKHPGSEPLVAPGAWSEHKFVRGKLHRAKLEQENEVLRGKLRSYEAVIERNNLWSFFPKTEEDRIQGTMPGKSCVEQKNMVIAAIVLPPVEEIPWAVTFM